MSLKVCLGRYLRGTHGHIAVGYWWDLNTHLALKETMINVVLDTESGETFNCVAYVER